MIYFEEPKKYFKIKDVAIKINIDKKKIYQSVRHMETYHLLRFKKTAFGGYTIEEQQIPELKEFIVLKEMGLSPKGAAENIVAKRSFIERRDGSRPELDMKWAKGLSYAVWRNF